ncbi:MAG: AAA family ATPase [Chloroflexota bacterium]
MIRLEALRARWIRGIKDSTLPFDGGSIVLGGANGSGKTGYVDAIEFLYRGRVGTLEGTSGLSAKHHLPHILADSEKPSVSARYSDDLRAGREFGSSLVADPRLRDYFDQAARVHFILRRSQLQEFIHAKPADRYRRMAELIGGASLDRTETGLKRALDTLDREQKSLRAELAQIQDQLKGRGPVESNEKLLARTNSVLAGEGIPPLADLDGIDSTRGQLLATLAAGDDDPREAARRHLSAELEQGNEVAEIAAAVDSYLAMFTLQTADVRREQMLELLEILQQSATYLQQASSDQCPVCEQQIETADLLRRLSQRAVQLEEVSLQRERLDRGRSQVESAGHRAATRLRSVEGAAKDAGDSTERIEELRAAVTIAMESVRGGALDEMTEAADHFGQVIARYDEWRQTRLQKDDVDGARERRQESINRSLSCLQQAAIERAQLERERGEQLRMQEQIEILRPKIEEVDRAQGFALLTFTTFNQVKNREVQAIYDALRSDLASFYDTLHPGEGHRAIALAMDEAKRGSTDLKMDFYSREAEDPRAFASEGHLDSLGLCIFLAFCRRFNGDWPLLVLDDVVSAVDSVHKQRLADLLFQEFGDRQLLITTHDSRWLKALQDAEIEAGCDGRTQNLIIKSWSIEEGPVLKRV